MILLQKRPVIILQNIAFQLIGCCGLDCEKCDARVATVTNDDALREKTAALWTKLNGVTITPEAYREHEIIALLIGQFTGIILIDSGLLWGLDTVLEALDVLLMRGTAGNFTYEKLLK